jgi:hypothetical protein
VLPEQNDTNDKREPRINTDWHRYLRHRRNFKYPRLSVSIRGSRFYLL